MLDKALQNIAISILWALNTALSLTNRLGFEGSLGPGLTLGVFVGLILFGIDQQIDEETARDIKIYVWGPGLGFLLLMICVVILQNTL
jgi:hypothetical protein